MFEVTDTPREVIRALGVRIEALRLSRGMTQEELAARCGFSKHTIERMESGQGNPRLDGFVTVCQVLGNLRGFDVLLPVVELSPSDIRNGRTLPKRARKRTTKKIIWGNEE